MGTPTTIIATGVYCKSVIIQDHLGISGTEDNGVTTGTLFYDIRWTGNATTDDCRGCTDGTNSVPVRGSGHPYVSELFASRIEIRPAENNTRTYFQARVEYTDDQNAVINPLDVPPDIQWDVAEDGQVPYFQDFDPAFTTGTPVGKPVANKAGERFNDFLQRYEGTVTATYSTNIPLTGAGSFNSSTSILYCTPVPAINSDTFTCDGQTINQYQARMRGCKVGGQQIQNGVKYRVQTWSLAFKGTWLDYIDNRGFNALVTIGSNNVLQEIIKGTPPVKPDSPWPLYSSGHAMPNVTDIPTPQLIFYPYPQLPFATLGFE